MWFGELPLSECSGCILAHSQRVGGERLAKGTVLNSSIIEKLSDAGCKALTVARLEIGDVAENQVAEKLAQAYSGGGVHLDAAHTGRVNIYATADGLLEYNRASVIAANSISPDITIAVVAPDQWVLAGRMIASVKIIPYAVAQIDLDRALAAASKLSVHPPKPLTAVLIQTVLCSIKNKVLDKTERVTSQRLEVRGSQLVLQVRCEHQINSVCEAIADVSISQPDIILIVGASAISDRCDVIPAAVEKQGGQVLRVGLPVDPGNLLMLAHYKGVPLLGLPGCARSPKHNGLDLLLDRIVCNVEVTNDWLNSLCIGGLLSEAHDRPQPRVALKSGRESRVAALVLAAGSSRRAGSVNKLLHSYKTMPMICSVVQSVLNSDVAEALVVTGHEPEQIESVLDNFDIAICHCPRYTEGMAHTIATGLSRLRLFDAVIVCLGDMPHVSADVINKIVASQKNVADKIVVPVHKGTRGNPVMFGRAFYDSLLQHEGDTGARFLMKQYPEKVVEVEISDDAVLKDYDTAAALQTLPSV